MTETSKRILIWLQARLIFLLPLLCVLLYFPALHHDFIMDDQYLVVGNPFIKNWKYLPQMLGQDIWNVSEPTNYWRPVFSLSLALDYSLWGLSPLGFHLTNILLHAISTALLFSLSKKLGSPTCALYAALLFAVHPVQAQAVNHVSARGDVLAAFFALLSLHAFLSRRMVPFALALMFALLSKETSLVLPLALLLAGILIQKDRKDSKLTLAFIILGLYFIVRLSLGFSFSLPELVFSYRASTSDRLLLVFKVLALYFHAIFNLFEMPHPIWTVEIPNSLFDPYVITGILILLLLLAVIWGTVKEKTVIAFGFLWFAIYYLPISNLKQLGLPMNEHWLYTPMIGLSLAFGTAMDALFLLRFSGTRLLRLGITTSVMVFLFFAVLVVREKTKLYQSDESFLTAAIRANPEIARLYSLLGNVYIEKRDIPKAQEVYAKALTLDINDLVANYMLGFLLYQAGQQDKAKIHLERVARMEPAIRAEFEPVAHAWEMLGDNQKALFYYRKALDVNPFSAWVQEKVAGLESR